MGDQREVVGEHLQLPELAVRGVEVMVGDDLQEVDPVPVEQDFGSERLAKPEPHAESRQRADHDHAPLAIVIHHTRRILRRTLPRNPLRLRNPLRPLRYILLHRSGTSSSAPASAEFRPGHQRLQFACSGVPASAGRPSRAIAMTAAGSATASGDPTIRAGQSSNARPSRSR